MQEGEEQAQDFAGTIEKGTLTVGAVGGRGAAQAEGLPGKGVKTERQGFPGGWRSG